VGFSTALSVSLRPALDHSMGVGVDNFFAPSDGPMTPSVEAWLVESYP
jgi:hypothetical protein